MPDRITCLTFDIGGTNLRAALYSTERRTLIQEVRIPTPSHWSERGASPVALKEALFTRMKVLASQICDARTVDVIAVAFPGPIDAHGNVLATPTVWGRASSTPFPLQRHCHATWPGAHITVLNDVSAAGYYYAFRGLRDFCIVTISSGIGNKIFIAGQPLIGRGRGGELGHVRVDYSSDAPVCDCGASGHLGAIASGRGVLRRAVALAKADPQGFATSLVGQRTRGMPDGLDTYVIAEAYRAGDEWASAVIRDTSRPLAAQLAAIYVTTGIERLIIIGGFALALGERYRQQLVGWIRQSCWDLGEDWDRVVAFGGGDSLGLLGAAEFALGTRRTAPCGSRGV